MQRLAASALTPGSTCGACHAAFGAESPCSRCVDVPVILNLN